MGLGMMDTTDRAATLDQGLNQGLGQTFRDRFAADVVAGLAARPKYLLSKYFYDDRGSQLFQQIMGMEDYYLTDCEFEILERHGLALLDLFVQGNHPFDLVELGAGDGLKTKVLLGQFLGQGADFCYAPIDISADAMAGLVADVAVQFPTLAIVPLVDDYFHGLHQLQEHTDRRRVVLFLGSSIGNFTNDGAIAFLRHLGDNLNPGDLLMIGFDLMKDPGLILRAYDDPAGITREFNLNLLDRINRELGGDFNRDRFRHTPTYDPMTGETKSYLVSTEAQTVHLSTLDQAFEFDAWEAIDMEISKKYSLREIDEIADRAGFVPVKSFFDERRWFVDAVWMR